MAINFRHWEETAMAPTTKQDPAHKDAAPFVKSIFESLGVTDKDVIKTLCGIASIHTLRKGECLFRQGEQLHSISFVVSGVVRAYYVDSDGREVTDRLIDRPNAPIIAVPALTSPALETIEALTACKLVCLDAEAYSDLLLSDHAVALAHIKLLSQIAETQWSLRTIVDQKDARGRYLWFLEEYPGLIDLIPHYYVASYLSITPVTLSRVRMALKQEAEQGK